MAKFSRRENTPNSLVNTHISIISNWWNAILILVSLFLVLQTKSRVSHMQWDYNFKTIHWHVNPQRVRTNFLSDFVVRDHAKHKVCNTKKEHVSEWMEWISIDSMFYSHLSILQKSFKIYLLPLKSTFTCNIVIYDHFVCVLWFANFHSSQHVFWWLVSHVTLNVLRDIWIEHYFRVCLCTPSLGQHFNLWTYLIWKPYWLPSWSKH